MITLIHEFITHQAEQSPSHVALIHLDEKFTYHQLYTEVASAANGLLHLGLEENERTAIYLPKLPETIFGLFGTALAGGVFVPVNPLLKPNQVVHILNDCNVRVLFTSANRLRLLAQVLADCRDLRAIVLIDEKPCGISTKHNFNLLSWEEFINVGASNALTHRRIDTDMAAILYTSGSSGKPKGVVLSHRNLVAGAQSVAQYLHNARDDRLLAVLPISFDYGLSQLTTAFSVGASVVLMEYLLLRDIVRSVIKHKITGLAAIPQLWIQLAQLEWPEEAVESLRYITNSGGAMPKATTASLRKRLPKTDIYLMYGLTEAFRSTYLPPDQVDARPDSIGKAIPNAEIEVVRKDGTLCDSGELGELVHRGALVALGYWNNPEATAKRFKPAPTRLNGLSLTEVAVWSGDQVRRDQEGYLYFIGRLDEMIKTSGYRVSPSEIEEFLYDAGLAEEIIAIGIPHPALGQAILLVLKPPPKKSITKDMVIKLCQQELPNFMVPQEIIFQDTLPKNKNGKIDRKRLCTQYRDIFENPAC